MSEIKRYDMFSINGEVKAIESYPNGKYYLASEVEPLLKEKGEEIKSQKWSLEKKSEVRDFWIKKCNEIQLQLQQKDEEIAKYLEDNDSLQKELIYARSCKEELDQSETELVNKLVSMESTLDKHRELMGRMVEYISKTSPYGEDSKLLTDYKNLEGSKWDVLKGKNWDTPLEPGKEL